MFCLNEVKLIGNLGGDPKVIQTKNNSPFVKMDIATNRKGKDKTTYTEWHTICISGKTAEFVAKTLKKGDRIYVNGELRTHKWESKNGQQSETAIYANQIQIVSRKVEDRSGFLSHHPDAKTPKSIAPGIHEEPANDQEDVVFYYE